MKTMKNIALIIMLVTLCSCQPKNSRDLTDHEDLRWGEIWQNSTLLSYESVLDLETFLTNQINSIITDNFEDYPEPSVEINQPFITKIWIDGDGNEQTAFSTALSENDYYCRFMVTIHSTFDENVYDEIEEVNDVYENVKLLGIIMIFKINKIDNEYRIDKTDYYTWTYRTVNHRTLKN